VHPNAGAQGAATASAAPLSRLPCSALLGPHVTGKSCISGLGALALNSSRRDGICAIDAHPSCQV
jgi:hypothetical protein